VRGASYGWVASAGKPVNQPVLIMTDTVRKRFIWEPFGLDDTRSSVLLREAKDFWGPLRFCPKVSRRVDWGLR